MIDPDLWKERLHPFEVEMRRHNEAWSWTSGGCFAFASAFQAAFGGEFYGVCRIWEEDGEIDFPVDHALVLLDGVYYDHSGAFDVTKLLPSQVVKHRDDDLVCWFEDDFFDERQLQEINAVLLDCSLKSNSIPRF
jgi:hypothetical protein